MVLFTEAETLRLLDLYVHLRANPRNVTANGVLLKMHARDELTRAMNKSFRREQPWTESQVSVKFKNLRSEYVELRWLASQSGMVISRFRADGAGLADAWWAAVKLQRPKCHAFKGKLPWPFAQKMALIVGDLPAGVSVSSSLSATGFSRLLGELGVSASSDRLAEREDVSHEPPRAEDGSSEAQQPPFSAPPQLSSSFAASGPPRLHVPSTRKRKRDVDACGPSRTPPIDAGQTTVGDAAVANDDGERRRALSRSVEQSSNAAADMARGFQELLAVFQEQSARCRLLEQQAATSHTQADAGTAALADQRSVVAAVAQSLEQSSRATAKMAQGYHELVKVYVLETDLERQQRDGP